MSTVRDTRNRYTELDDDRMWKYITKEVQRGNVEARNFPKGLEIWKTAKDAKVTNHSYQSMASHFRKILLPNPQKSPPEIKEEVHNALRIWKMEYLILNRRSSSDGGYKREKMGVYSDSSDDEHSGQNKQVRWKRSRTVISSDSRKESLPQDEEEWPDTSKLMGKQRRKRKSLSKKNIESRKQTHTDIDEREIDEKEQVPVLKEVQIVMSPIRLFSESINGMVQRGNRSEESGNSDNIEKTSENNEESNKRGHTACEERNELSNKDENQDAGEYSAFRKIDTELLPTEVMPFNPAEFFPLESIEFKSKLIEMVRAGRIVADQDENELCIAQTKELMALTKKWGVSFAFTVGLIDGREELRDLVKLEEYLQVARKKMVQSEKCQ